MERETIHTDDAPAAIGPYVQAVKANGLVFCSGQIALDPRSGEIVGAGDVAAQTEQVMQNLEAMLADHAATPVPEWIGQPMGVRK